KLARWLRVLGFDVAYSNVLDDDEIVRLADSEHRIVLTRDTGLVARCRDVQCLLIQSVDYKEQVQQLLHTFELNQFTEFSPSLECTSSLEDTNKATVYERDPSFVSLTKDRFATCTSCHRV